MKMTTIEKLNQHHIDWFKGGSRPEKINAEFVDVIRDACDESVDKDFFWLPQVYRENASEIAQVKIKTWLITKHGDEAIKSLPAMIRTICYREACSEARKSCVVYRDPKTGVVAIDKNTGKVRRVPKTISIDLQNEEDDASSRASTGEPESRAPSPADELERRDMRCLLQKIDAELGRVPKQKAEVFRLVAYQGYSALDTARIVFHSKISDADTAMVKKKEQNRIVCIIDRIRRKLIDTFGCQAFELGILSKSRMRTR